MDSNSVYNFISYNSYYALFLTYVFPVLLLILISLAIGYLASINHKLKEIFAIENNDNKIASVKADVEQTSKKTLYDVALIPAIIVSVLIVFLLIISLLFSF